MNRYIDADELIRYYEPYADMKVPVNALLEQIKDTSTTDVEPVRHGHWTITHPPKYMRLDRRTDVMECSECGHQILRRTGEIANYCPNCGTMMIRKEQKNEGSN